MSFAQPRIVISKCLEFESCRYNGDIIPNKFIRILMDWVEFMPVCPEVEVGLGIPREPIRLVGKKEDHRLIQPATDRDLTADMIQFSETYLNGLPSVEGFILKSRSPSCGVHSPKGFPYKGKVAPSFHTSGLFTQTIEKLYPDYPTEEEVRFTDQGLREHFLTAIFTLAQFRQVSKTGEISALVKFQSRTKLLLMAYNQTLMRRLGNIVANHQQLAFAEVCSAYAPLLRKVFQRRPRYVSNINVQMHALGYFSDQLKAEEKAYFLDLLEEYRNARIPLAVLNGVMRSWVVRFENEYLQQQVYFNPFPEDLVISDLKGLKRK